MKLLTFNQNGTPCVGLKEDTGIRELSPLADQLGLTLKAMLEREALSRIQDHDLSQLPLLDPDTISYLPPIPNPEKILCIGINYAKHIEETGMPKPRRPMVFTRFPDTQVGHQEALIRPAASNKYDFEGELAVIIGRSARNVPADQALDVIAGYSCYNDGSVRDWQVHTSQFTPGKNFPRSGSFGPWLVTPDEIPDPSQLHLVTRVNGEILQDTLTSDLIFDIPALIEYISTFTPLSPGDVIVTGTPGGAGAFRDPKVWLQPGDRVEVDIEGIGLLSNEVVAEG